MAWIYLAASEDSPYPWHLGCVQSPTVKMSDTLRLCSCPECDLDLCPRLPFGMMYAPCKRRPLKLELKLFTAAFRVRTSALQEMAKAWQESEADFFSRSVASSTNSNRRSSSLKMYQQFGPVGENKWGRNWPAEGMIVAGLCYPLKKSERHTSGNDGFFSPSIPTPLANDAKATRNQTARRSPGAKYKAGTTLTDYVTLFPTPAANSYGSNMGGAAGRIGMAWPSLETMARHNLWPTPRATDGSNEGPNQRGSRGDLALPAAAAQSSTTGGQLNPTWVEWLMGYPLGWTALEDWAMQWCRPKREKRSKD